MAKFVQKTQTILIRKGELFSTSWLAKQLDEGTMEIWEDGGDILAHNFNKKEPVTTGSKK